MATEIVTVCLEPVRPSHTMDAVREAMDPFYVDAEPRGMENAGGEWDWWHVFGGDGESGLPVSYRFVEDPRIIRNYYHKNGDPRTFSRLRCDGGPRECLEFDRDRRVEEECARRQWMVLRDKSAGFHNLKPLSQYVDESGGRAGREVRHEYMAQPYVRLLVEAGMVNSAAPMQEIDDPIAHILMGVDEFVRRRVAQVIPTSALLTLDGDWVEPVASANIRKDDERMNRYFHFADEYLSTLNPAAQIVRVRFHS